MITQGSLVETVQVSAENTSNILFFVIIFKIIIIFTLVCGIDCTKPGHILNHDKCRCELNNMCEAERPCVNGATCFTGSTPLQYHCKCPNKFRGKNCSGLIDVTGSILYI